MGRGRSSRRRYYAGRGEADRVAAAGTLQLMAANLVPASLSVGDAAQLRGVRECLQWFTREKQWINEVHLQLCRIPAPTFLEQQRSEWVAAHLRSAGWHV